MIKCKNCGHEHPSFMQTDRASFEANVFRDNSEHCPKCGSMSTYNKSDYFFKD